MYKSPSFTVQSEESEQDPEWRPTPEIESWYAVVTYVKATFTHAILCLVIVILVYEITRGQSTQIYYCF